MSSPHLAFPGLLRIEPDASGRSALFNPHHNTSLDLEEEDREVVHGILDAFAQRRSLEGYVREHPELEDVVQLLVQGHFIVSEAELPFLRDGFLRQASEPIGAPCSWTELDEKATNGAWAIMGVPIDMGAGIVGGARQGPSEIRRAWDARLLSLDNVLLDLDYGRIYRTIPSVIDLGDVDVSGANLADIGARLKKAMIGCLDRGMRPLVLGGDHSITHFALEAIASRFERFGLVHIDTHHDIQPGRALSHATSFQLAARCDAIDPFVQIGLHGLERVPRFARPVPCEKRVIVSARDVLRGRALEIIARLPRDIPYYLSFDVDALDQTIASETGTPSFGGLGFWEASDLVDQIGRTLRLVGADVVEVGARERRTNSAAAVAARMVQRILFADLPHEPLTTDVYAFPDGRD